MPRAANPTGSLSLSTVKARFAAGIALIKAGDHELNEDGTIKTTDKGEPVKLDEESSLDRVLSIRAFRDETIAVCKELNGLLIDGKALLDGITENQKKLGLKR